MSARNGTKAPHRAVNVRIRALQRERRDVLRCAGIPWGLALACDGPGSLGHQEPLCEGCMHTAYRRDRANDITRQIRELQALLEPAAAVQGALW